MKRSFTAVFLALTLLIAGGCGGYLNVSDEPVLIVEAWIEDGGFPVVIVTTSVSQDELPADARSMEEHMVRWAKVWMSDGTRTVNLTGVPTDKYFPPYVYTTAGMRGEAGKSYDLVVEYGNVRVTATAEIPQSVPIDDVKLVHERDSLYSAYAYYKLRTTGLYGKFFVRIDGGYWTPALFGSLFGMEFLEDGEGSVVRRGYGVSMQDYDSYFVSGEIVEVKLCTMTDGMFYYWKKYDDNVIYGRTPFFPAKTNPESNLHGAWLSDSGSAGFGVAASGEGSGVAASGEGSGATGSASGEIVSGAGSGVTDSSAGSGAAASGAGSGVAASGAGSGGAPPVYGYFAGYGCSTTRFIVP
ncbi:MAG: DUF4249 family protein [Candidatus Cryptobacteroides sp.]